MKIPFTIEQFTEVFIHYNTGIFPLQIVFYLLGITGIYFAVKKYAWSDRIITLVLAGLWLWMGIVYHLVYFSTINQAANLFGILFIMEALLLLLFGVIKNSLSFHFSSSGYGLTGGMLIFFALLIYPAIGYFSGHEYPASATFGLPCPTTIFTFGLLLWTDKKCPIILLIIPFLWSIVGFSAAFLLGIHEDIGLLISGLVATLMIVIRNKKIGSARLTYG